MLRLKTKNHDVKDEYLSIPDSQPVTLLQVSSENLPYACQCPLCGGVFEIPEGILYKVEEDDLPDEESNVEMSEEDSEPSSNPGLGDGGFFGGEGEEVGGEEDFVGDEMEG